VTELAFLFRMAGRELRAARARAALLAGTVAIGVSALVAIASFTENLRSSVDQQARTLLGADLAFSSRQPFSKSTEAVLDTLARQGVRRPSPDQLEVALIGVLDSMAEGVEWKDPGVRVRARAAE